MHRSNYWWRRSGTAQRSCFLSQMSNIFGARLNHTTVNKTHLTVQLLSSSVLLLHVRNKFTGTLQWLLHWRPASRKHASCCQDRLMRNQCTHEQITTVYTLFWLLVSISSQRRFDQCSESISMCHTCVHQSEHKLKKNQVCMKHRLCPKLMCIWESFRANEVFKDKHSFTWRHCTDVANRLQLSNSLQVILGEIYWHEWGTIYIITKFSEQHQ